MTNINKPYTFSANTTASSSQVNDNFDTIYNDYNGGISSTNLADGAVTAAKIGTSAVTTAKIIDDAVTNAKMATDVKPYTLFNETTFDFVASGCVWSGDSYGSTRAASMTAGVVYINGQRVAVSAVTARSFTASRDTYIDVGTDGVVDYSESTNNAASQALAADHVRLGIIVTGASTIANVGSVNQGQEDRVLPIASSVAYAVTDSLGNLICPRDPQSTIMGMKRVTSALNTTSTSPAQITGMSITTTIPLGRKAKISIECDSIENSVANSYASLTIWSGTVGSGTQLARAISRNAVANEPEPAICIARVTGTGSSVTFNAALNSVTSGTSTINAGAAYPAYFVVELS